MTNEELKQHLAELHIEIKNDKVLKKDILAALTILGTGEMSQEDIDKGGEFYDDRISLEEICREVGMKCKVKPFDVYRGPFAALENGGKLWFEGKDLYYEGPKGPKALDYKKMVEFLSSIAPVKPKLAYESPKKEKPTGLKEPHTRSTPEQRKHLQLIKSILAHIEADLKIPHPHPTTTRKPFNRYKKVTGLLSRMERKLLLKDAAKHPTEECLYNSDNRLGMPVDVSFKELKTQFQILRKDDPDHTPKFSSDDALIEYLVENDYDIEEAKRYL